MYYEEYDDGVGINKVANNMDFKVYPNPAKNELHINAGSNKVDQIRIVDVNGRIIFQSKGNVAGSLITIPVSKLAAGVYILQLNGANQTGTKTFVVEQ